MVSLDSPKQTASACLYYHILRQKAFDRSISAHQVPRDVIIPLSNQTTFETISAIKVTT
jgi:hypothetical protein